MTNNNHDDKETINRMEIRDAFEALDLEYKGFITFEDTYTIYLAYDYQPNDLTFHAWKSHLLINNFSNYHPRQHLLQQQYKNIERNQFKIEDVLFILSMVCSRYSLLSQISKDFLLTFRVLSLYEMNYFLKFDYDRQNRNSFHLLLESSSPQQQQYITANDILNIAKCDVQLNTVITESIAQKMISYGSTTDPTYISKQDFDRLFSKQH